MAVFGLEAIPLIHDLVYFLAVIYFYSSLHAIGFRSIAALAVAVPHCLVSIQPFSHSNILTDSLALSLSLVCLAAFNYTWAPKATTLPDMAGYDHVHHLPSSTCILFILFCAIGRVWTTYFLIRNAVPLQLAFPRSQATGVSVIPFFGYAILRESSQVFLESLPWWLQHDRYRSPIPGC